MMLKHVHENHLRVSKGEKLTTDMLREELSECKSALKAGNMIQEKCEMIKRHVKTLEFIIKSRINE